MIDDYSKDRLTTAYQELDDCLGLLSKAADELLRTPQCKYKSLADRVYELHAGICRLQESIMGIMIQGRWGGGVKEQG